MSDLISQEKLNTEEAARLLGLSTVTVRSLVRGGTLGCIELGSALCIASLENTLTNIYNGAKCDHSPHE
jgi:excisionase family DNA binding protein